ncbi:hypothetical protein KVT40_001906 [Elsinoe batatas]|uniref:Uncharacterized protein n=1 Tax=Elsinoe batatas TaxID=2601811 RepID=A0A8K0PJ88_9PEZI|nr:hypothetical protein KVT40_001906 [Elsinoe batatas]
MASASSAQSRIPRPNITTRRHTPQTTFNNPNITENAPPATNRVSASGAAQPLTNDPPPDDLADDPYDDPPLETPAMEDPATATWNLPLSDADLKKLKAGYQSQCMEEKWNFTLQDPDPRGSATLRTSRSWTDIEHYLLHLDVSDEPNGSRIESITWSQNVGEIKLDEEQAKIEAIILCRGWLECVFLDVPYLDPNRFDTHPNNFYTPERFLDQYVKRFFTTTQWKDRSVGWSGTMNTRIHVREKTDHLCSAVNRMHIVLDYR